MKRTIVFGDVYGCLVELDKLLGAVAARAGITPEQAKQVLDDFFEVPTDWAVAFFRERAMRKSEP